jgi:lipoprotein signal peptidase
VVNDVETSAANSLPLKLKVMAVALVLMVAGVLLAVDLWSKYAAYERLVISKPIERDATSGRVMFIHSDEIPFIQSVLHFRFTVNEGAIFGIGQGKRWLFVVVSFFAIALLTSMAWRGGRWWQHMLLGLLLAGVLGNLYDRWYYGFVRDMLYAFPGSTWGDFALTRSVTPTSIHNNELFPWIFNLADCFLVVGVTLLVIQSLLVKDQIPAKAIKLESEKTAPKISA